jgi:mono/diheme cytochrome c family protein
VRHWLIPLLPCALACASPSAAEGLKAQGEGLFAQHCAPCHGSDGKGGGDAAASLGTEPADLTRIADRRGGVWPMLEVMSIIDGYTRRVAPRADMPVIADLSEGPIVEFDTGNGVVTSVPERLVALADYLESIQSPRPERYAP